MKSDLEGRPVYVWKDQHIEAHFLTCYVALIISRILQYKLNYKYSVQKIQESLNGANCILISKNLYILTKRDEVYNHIEKLFNVSLDFKHTRIEQIRNYRKNILVHNK